MSSKRTLIYLSHFITSRKSWLILSDSLHTNSRRLPWSRKHMTHILTSAIVVVFSSFDLNLCYSLYIDKVMWLESMLDMVTVTAICRKFFFILLMHY